LGDVACGIDYELEKQANELLRRGRAGVTKLSEKKDYFTEEQLATRYSHEVYNVNGVPDPHIVSGLFRRAYNPTFGHRPAGCRFNSEEW
jgi:hypothetical protein